MISFKVQDDFSASYNSFLTEIFPQNDRNSVLSLVSGSGSTSRSEFSLTKRLQGLLEKNPEYQIVQQNGQRIFELLPNADVFVPPRGCEVFIGNIPKHVFEDELIPLFQTVGRLHKFRLMLDFNQRTRGYGFATYFDPYHVTQAIQRFNRYEILRDVPLGVYKSIDNRRLFVGNIPKNRTKEDIFEVFINYVEGLVDVIMYPNWQDKNLNRGFAFLEFETHIQASVARRQLHPRNLVVWEHALYVDWAEPIPEVSPVIMSQVTVLYIKNLPCEMPSGEAHRLFRNIVGPTYIRKTHKIMTFAFIHCRSRACAEIVMEKLEGLIVADQEIQIEWARPRQYSTQWRTLFPPQNFCLSVPLRSRQIVRQVAASRKASVSAACETESLQQTSSSFSSSSERQF